MTVRQVMYYPGSVSVPGYPKLDCTASEIEVANIASLKYWPGLNDWDVPDGLITDRLNDAVIATYGATTPANQFVTMPANGKKGYKVTTMANALVMPGLNTAGSFTVGLVCGAQLALGSIVAGLAADTLAPWTIYTDIGGSGVITYAIGYVSGTSGAWPVPKLNDAKLTSVVLIVDRVLGKITFRFDGVEAYTYTNANVKTLGLLPEINMGVIKVAGAGTPIATRTLTTNAFAAFESALSGAELKSFESMLMAAAA